MSIASESGARCCDDGGWGGWTPQFLAQAPTVIGSRWINVGSDHLEWPWKAGREGSKFFGGSLYIRSYRLAWNDRIQHTTHVMNERVLELIHAIHPKTRAPAFPILGTLYTYSHTEWPRMITFCSLSISTAVYNSAAVRLFVKILHMYSTAWLYKWLDSFSMKSS